MVWIYRKIMMCVPQSVDAMKSQGLTPQRNREYNEQHLALYGAIRTRDIEAAVRSSPITCMRETQLMGGHLAEAAQPQ